MATTTTTLNMSLVLPVPGSLGELGPQWAVDQNTAFGLLDAHDHSSGKGVKVPAGGLNINADLAFGGFNATALNSTRYSNLGANLAGPADLSCLYVKSGDLWYNNAAGAQVQVTSGGTLNSGALTANTWATQAVSTNLTILPGNANVAFDVDTTAGRAITLPAANAVAVGRYYIFKDVSGLANTNTISLLAAGSDTIDNVGSQILRSNRGAWIVRSDGVSKWTMYRFEAALSGIGAPVSGPSTGNVLMATSAQQLAWNALNLAGGANYVTGVLPAANLPSAASGALGVVQLTGSFAGTATAPTLSSAVTVPNAAPFSLTPTALVATSATPTALTFQGADAYTGGGATAAPGGAVTVKGGRSFGASAGDANVNGAIVLYPGGIGALAYFGEPATGRAVIGLGGQPTATDFPANAGVGVVWLKNTSKPAGGSSTGAIIYGGTASSVLAGNPTTWGSRVGLNYFESAWSTSNTATAGAAGALPNVSAYLNVDVGGIAYKIPLVNP